MPLFSLWLKCSPRETDISWKGVLQHEYLGDQGPEMKAKEVPSQPVSVLLFLPSITLPGNTAKSKGFTPALST